MIVISPFAKQGYVSHTVMDTDRDPEVHRDSLRPAQPDEPRCSATGYVGVLRLYQRSEPDRTVATDAADECSLHGSHAALMK